MSSESAYERVKQSADTVSEEEQSKYERQPWYRRIFQLFLVWQTFVNHMKASFSTLKGSPSELYINFFLHFCESYSYFALSQILVIYLHTTFGVSDLEAGASYGLWGAAITFWGFVMGCINDKLGIRRSLLVGFTVSAIATGTIALTTSKQMLYIALFAVLPIGNCMGLPMLTVAVKRFTTPLNRGFAFGLYYSVMNIAALLAGPVVDGFNFLLPINTNQEQRSYLTGNRLVIMSVTISNLISLIVTFFFMYDTPTRPLAVEVEIVEEGLELPNKETLNLTTVQFQRLESDDSDTDLLYDKDKENREETQPRNSDNDEAAIEESNAATSSTIVKELLFSATFWRFVVFTLFMIMVFRHLDATLPTYLLRCFGSHYPKGIIYSINPFLIIWLTPVVAAMTSSWPHYDMIKVGGYCTALSTFFLAVSTSTTAVVMFMILLSLGEALWSPRVYDYSMSIAPVGREASFSALASAPLFVAKIPVGLLSGYLISHYLPEDDQSQSRGDMQTSGRQMWLVIDLLTISSPILITLCESCIREPIAATAPSSNYTSAGIIQELLMEDQPYEKAEDQEDDDDEDRKDEDRTVTSSTTK